MTDVLLFDEAQTEVIRLVTNKVNRRFSGKIEPFISPDRYTNRVDYLGGRVSIISFSGSLIAPFTSSGSSWTTSSGANPIPTLLRWERTGKRLTYRDEVGTLTSANIDSFSYKLIEGIPLDIIIYYQMSLKVGSEP